MSGSKVPDEQREQELINVQTIDWCLADHSALAACIRGSHRGTRISQVNSTKDAGDGLASFGQRITSPESFIASQNGNLRTVLGQISPREERPLAEDLREDS